MPAGSVPKSYLEVLQAAIADITANGYDSEERIRYWSEEIRRAAERSMKSDAEIDRMVREAMTEVYRKQVEAGGVIKRNPGVSKYTLEQVKPELRAELDRRIAASADLIKLRRPQTIDLTLQRFRGWATSVPAGGSRVVEKGKEKENLRKALAQSDYAMRRVIIDQSHKLANAINDTVAIGGGAVGATWMSHKNQPGYNGRPDHNARDGKFFLLRGSWADQAGYVKPAGHQYTDEVTQPGEEVFCRCAWTWKFSLRSIPPECLTERGKEALAEARRKIAAMR